MFRPGYVWRILAHHRTTRTPDAAYGERVVLRSTDHATPVQFDELVIDHWFHLEQMDDRSWWMDVAGVVLNVSLDARGRPSVVVEVEDSPDEVAARWQNRTRAD